MIPKNKKKGSADAEALLPGDPSKFRVAADYPRARAAFDALLSAFRSRAYPFKDFVSFVKPNLEKPLPEDPRSRALFWMCLCFWMRGRIESYEALWRLARVWHEDPEVFEPAFWEKPESHVTHRERLSSLLKRHGLAVGVDKYHASDWPLNLQKVQRFWGGDPRTLVAGARTFEDLLARIENRKKFSPDRPEGFRGFRRKMVAMLAHFFSADGLAHADEFPFPVDIHVGRFLLYQGALSVERKSRRRWVPAGESWDVRYEDAVQPSIDVCLRYMAERSVSAVELGDAVWNFAQTMCAEAPQNRWLLHGEYSGRGTRLSPVTVTASAPQYRRYVATCRSCPVRDGCVGGTIGTAPYFYWGTFSKRPTPNLAETFAPMSEAGQLLDLGDEAAAADTVPLGKAQRAWARMSAEPLGPGKWMERGKPKVVRLEADSSQLELGV